MNENEINDIRKKKTLLALPSRNLKKVMLKKNY